MEWIFYLTLIVLRLALLTNGRSHGEKGYDACENVPLNTLRIFNDTENCGMFVACIGKLMVKYKCFSNPVYGSDSVNCLKCNEKSEIQQNNQFVDYRDSQINDNFIPASADGNDFEEIEYPISTISNSDARITSETDENEIISQFDGGRDENFYNTHKNSDGVNESALDYEIYSTMETLDSDEMNGECLNEYLIDYKL